jgi:ankyrin repeat protein
MDKLLTTNPNIANQRDKNGNTPLMLSINYNKDELLISKLLSYTSDINARNSNGDNCLMLAIENGNKKIVDLIMQTDINVNNQ